MVTKEQYEEAKKIVEEFELYLQMQEEEEDEYDRDTCMDEEDRREAEYERLCELAGTCTCGAWQLHKNKGAIHVADCICGAE